MPAVQKIACVTTAGFVTSCSVHTAGGLRTGWTDTPRIGNGHAPFRSSRRWSTLPPDRHQLLLEGQDVRVREAISRAADFPLAGIGQIEPILHNHRTGGGFPVADARPIPLYP